jgi:hypothetical protein
MIGPMQHLILILSFILLVKYTIIQITERVRHTIQYASE